MTQLYDIKDIKHRSDLAEAARSAGLDLKKRHGEWVACCPFHTEKTASFSIYEKGGGQLFKCFGCGEGGDVIEFVKKIYSMSTFEALQYLSGKTGSAPLPVAPGAGGGDADKLRREERAAARKKDAARTLYKSGMRWHSTVAAYLKSRHIDIEKIGGVPQVLRFHPEVLNTDTGEVMPAMLAPIINLRREIISVHRTYLKPDGSGKADVEKPKKVLGRFSGGFIPLYEMTDTLNITEGIETALSVRMYGVTGGFWTSIALDNMSNLIVPPQAVNVTIWADNDMKDPEPGKADPRARIYKAAQLIREQKAGRRVFVKWPPKGMDFNDMLKAGMPI